MVEELLLIQSAVHWRYEVLMPAQAKIQPFSMEADSEVLVDEGDFEVVATQVELTKDAGSKAAGLRFLGSRICHQTFVVWVPAPHLRLW